MPDTLVDADLLKAAVQLACRAPSLHNSQPWHWVAEGTGLRLYVDCSRILPLHRQVGAGGLHQLRRRARPSTRRDGGSRVDCQRRRFPDPNNPDHLASFDLSPMSLVTDGHRRRADAILHRRTDRLPFAAPRN